MRVEVNARTYEELLRKLEGLDDNVREVYVSLRPTKEVVVKILENAPNVEKISCPPSLYPRVSKKVIAALKQLGIQLVPEKKPRGRPRKYDEETLRLVRELADKGTPIREISTRLGIPLRTVYYLVRGEVRR
ncbi:DUF1699 family protein [Thermococcus sp.]|uniref:DUF1699 family protein n=1 Tax=Thermococcus sp. TaxID=35749 RepID=UPI002609C4BA|nr:DUF1699 family protein [Thermococcus sp.]